MATHAVTTLPSTPAMQPNKVNAYHRTSSPQKNRKREKARCPRRRLPAGGAPAVPGQTAHLGRQDVLPQTPLRSIDTARTLETNLQERKKRQKVIIGEQTPKALTNFRRNSLARIQNIHQDRKAFVCLIFRLCHGENFTNLRGHLANVRRCVFRGGCITETTTLPCLGGKCNPKHTRRPSQGVHKAKFSNWPATGTDTAE